MNTVSNFKRQSDNFQSVRRYTPVTSIIIITLGVLLSSWTHKCVAITSELVEILGEHNHDLTDRVHCIVNICQYVVTNWDYIDFQSDHCMCTSETTVISGLRFYAITYCRPIVYEIYPFVSNVYRVANTGAGKEVRGAGNEVRGAGNEVRGAGEEVRGADEETH